MVEDLSKKVFNNEEFINLISDMNNEQQLKLKSLILTYIIMLRKDNNIMELSNNLKIIIMMDSNFRYGIGYTDYLVKFILEHNKNYINISNEILNNYIVNGYYYHSYNSGLKESIKNNGLTINNKPWDEEEIIKIRNLFNKRNIYDIFGLYKNNNTPVYLDTSLNNSSYYGLSTPTWFMHFVTGGFTKKDGYDKDAFINRDYDSCLNNIIKLIKDSKLRKEEEKEVLDFFNKYYNYLGNNTKGNVLLIKRSDIDKKDYEFKDSNNDDYNYIMKYINLYCRGNILIKEDILPDKLTFIDYNCLIKERKREI